MNSPLEYAWVKPESLSAARLRLGLTPEAVASQSKKLRSGYSEIETADLASWEAGRSAPELDSLETLGKIYVCPVGWFFLDRLPREPKRLDFRGVTDENLIDSS